MNSYIVLLKAMVQKGEPLSWRQSQTLKRYDRTDRAKKELWRRGIPFEEIDSHLIVDKYSYFPMTGVWLGNGRTGRGFKALLNELGARQ